MIGLYSVTCMLAALLTGSFLVEKASATPISSSFQVAGGMSGGGGDPLRFYFEEGRKTAQHILHQLTGRTLDWNNRPDVAQWISDNRLALAHELKETQLHWENGRDTCAWTRFEPLAPIVLSFERCRGQISTAEEAAKLLIHEATHHLNIENETFADLVALEVFAAWERLKTMAVPPCPQSQNVVATVLPGSWIMDVELRKRLNPVESDLDSSKLVFVENENVAEEFPPLGLCALKSGSISFESFRKEEKVTYPEIIVVLNGNETLVWLEGLRDDGTPDLETSILNAARAGNEDQDLLFFGNDFNTKGTYPFKRYLE